MSDEQELTGQTAIPDDEYRRCMETALEHLGTGVVFTRHGKLVYANDALFEILGYERAEMQLRDTIALAAEEEQARLRELLAARLRGELETVVYDVRIRRGTGEPAIVHVASTPTPVPGQALTLVTDVTHERALARAAQQQQRMEAIGHFATNVAQDFTRHLDTIRNLGERLLDADVDDRRALVAELNASTAAAAHLTQQLLTFAGADAPPQSVFDINVVIYEVAALLRHLIGSDVELALNLEPGLPPTQIEPAQLRRVLTNLVVNAHQAMEGGGRITIQTIGREDVVELIVVDDGVGMEPDVLQRACEPFFTTRPGDAAGMGLAIVFGIARRCGGTLEIDSIPGGGTSVRLVLPHAQT